MLSVVTEIEDECPRSTWQKVDLESPKTLQILAIFYDTYSDRVIIEVNLTQINFLAIHSCNTNVLEFRCFISK